MIRNTDNVKKYVSNNEGDCPICGKADLEYGTMDRNGEGLSYEWTCMKCGATGKEWYDVTFSSHGNVIKKNGESVLNESGY